MGGRTLQYPHVPCNAALDPERVRRFCTPNTAAQKLLNQAFDKLGLSARAVVRILKVARTIADLADGNEIGPAHVAEAIQYRALDRRLA